jgi:hypothetical protein
VTRRHSLFTCLLLAAVVAVPAGCGSGSANNSVAIQPTGTIHVTDFRPTKPVQAGKPTTVSFKIAQASGRTMTRFRTGSGPHTGVHLIIVRDDLGAIIHRHPPIGPGGVFTQQITFPTPGPYRVVLDVYPALTSGAQTFQQTNFQLTGETIRVAGAYKPQGLPKPARTATVDGYRFRIVKIVPSPLRAISSALVYMTVTDPRGRPVTFTPWYGALAHAIFFHHGRFEYFHTHVCSPGAGGCTSVLGASRVTGSSATPGHLTVGVLLPDSGTWRLFLQLRAGGRILTAPFTLQVG